MQATTDEVDGEQTSQTVPERNTTPVAEIAGRTKGALRVKINSLVTDFSNVLTDLGWDTYDEFDDYEYHEMDVAHQATVLLAEINGAINARKKPPSEMLLGNMQAVQLAKTVRGISRERMGIPTQLGSPGAKSQGTVASTRTESELSRDTARLTVFSHIRCDEKLEVIYGADKPAHVYDTAAYCGEVAKFFVGMEGHSALQSQLDMRRIRPDMDIKAFVTNDDIPLDLWKHYARLLYGGVTTQYKKEVLSKSKHGKQLFDAGTMAYALYQISTDVNDYEATRRKLEYQQPVAIRPNDKPRLEAAFRQFERSSFELMQLRELGSARTAPHTMQYRAGNTIFSNYCELSHSWARMWGDRDEEDRDMAQMRKMMEEMAELVRQLPDRPYRAPVHPPGMQPRANAHPPAATGGTGRHICREFQRTGKCSWGKDCKFEHTAAAVVLTALTSEDNEVSTLQGTMNTLMWTPTDEICGDISDIRKAEPELQAAYDVTYDSIGTPEFTTNNRELLAMIAMVDTTSPQASVDGWNISRT